MKNLRNFTQLALKSLRKSTAPPQSNGGAANANSGNLPKIDYAQMRLYKSKPVYDLVNMLTMNTLCTSDTFVDHCDKLYNYSNKILGNYQGIECSCIW
jgi:hypothetical protein